MTKTLLLAITMLICISGMSQGFEITPLQEVYKGSIGETIRVPLRFKNNSDKPMTLVVRKVFEQIGSTQKKYFCIDNNCLDSKLDEYLLKVEPGQTVTNFFVALEGGLNDNESTIRYFVFNRSNPNQSLDIDLNFAIEDKRDMATIYNSRHITLYDIFPNPASDAANLAYKLTSDQVNAKVLLHNILGNIIGEYPLSTMETQIRIRTEDLSPGIYFYTLYVDNEGVLTRKLLVKK